MGHRARKVAVLGSGVVLAVGAAGTTKRAPHEHQRRAPRRRSWSRTSTTTGAGSLSDAIDQANANVGQDTITFQTGLTGTITLTADLPKITDAVDIQGPSASAITVDGANTFALLNFYGISSAAGADSVSPASPSPTGCRTTATARAARSWCTRTRRTSPSATW